MGLEIERKFLVVNDEWRKSVVSQSHMQQGYLATQGNASIRVRISDTQAMLNIKSVTVGIRRHEFEYSIPLNDAQEMLRHVAIKPFIDKTRYRVSCGEHIWDLDLFHGENEGLIVAEIELMSEEQSFTLPSWVGEEVSDDTRYYNVNLVKHPFSSW